MPDKTDQEPPGGGTRVEEVPKPSSRRAYSNVRRELSEEELAHPAVHRLIISDIDQCEDRISELEKYQDDFHAADRSKAVLEERLQSKTSLDILHDVSLGVGFFLCGLSPSIWNERAYAVLSLAAGVLLIVCGILAKKYWR